MTPTIHLHVGEPKSGTTYLQAMLDENREALEQAGLLTPGQREQIRSAQDAIRGTSDGQLWQAMAHKLVAWSGSDALVSMETLCRANPSSVKRAVRAFGDAEVRVHITVRDVLRSLPAQWQQSTQHRKTWTWPEYSGAVIAGQSGHAATRNFWSQHDLEAILKRWSKVVGAQRVYVITVPRGGADPLLLWQRFAQALSLPAVEVSQVSPSNESLGEVSAELMRRVNEAIEPLELSEKQYNHAVRAVLARKVLAPRRSAEPKVLPPPEAAPWAQRESERLIAAVTDAGVHVVGDLDELRPQVGETGPVAHVPSDSDLAVAATEAVSGLVAELARGVRS
jgi:hypothetical protein